MDTRTIRRLAVAAGCWAGFLLAGPAPRAADQPQWGQRLSRNMVSQERGLPVSCDL